MRIIADEEEKGKEEKEEQREGRPDRQVEVPLQQDTQRTYMTSS